MSTPTEHIDLSAFTRDNSFYGELNLLTTVKSFDLSAIRKRYLKSQKENKSGAVGSVERRKPGIGGVVACTLKNGRGRYDVIKKMTEPRGIAYRNGRLAVASEKRVYVIFEEEGKYTELTYPWFSYIHSLDFHPADPNKILLDSSGFDCIFEFDIQQNKPTFEWFAWENGFNRGKDPKTGEDIFLTRKKEDALKMKGKTDKVVFVNDPEQVYLPTAWRSFFINTVKYHTSVESNIVVTSFHKGIVYTINLTTNEITPELEGLNSPHGGQNYDRGFMATSTRSGEVVILENGRKIKIDFSRLPGKSKQTENLEWIQNSIVTNNYIVAIDSNRNSFVIIDLKNRLYDLISYDDDWAVQDLIANESTKKQLSNLSAVNT